MIRLVIIIFLACLASCANPVAPNGGPKDKLPPIIINQTYDSINQKLTIEFNENIRFQNNIILIPKKPAEKATIKTSNKTIFLLIPPHTQHINLGTSIKDLNENNLGKYHIIHLNQDTQSQVKRISYPSFLKSEIIAQTKKDSFIYEHQVTNDTITQCCIQTTGPSLTITSDENKNNNTDSFEWTVQSKDTLLYLYEPIKPKVQVHKIDSLNLIITGTDVQRIIPHIKQPFKKYKDTLILSVNYQSLVDSIYYINKNSTLKRVINKVYHFKDSTFLMTHATETTKGSQDSAASDTIQIGFISIKNRTEDYITLSIYEEERKIYQKTIGKLDSLRYPLPPGKYHYLTYNDNDHNERLSSSDEVIDYFKEMAIIRDVENHIDIVKTSKKPRYQTRKSSSNIQKNKNFNTQEIKRE